MTLKTSHALVIHLSSTLGNNFPCKLTIYLPEFLLLFSFVETVDDGDNDSVAEENGNTGSESKSDEEERPMNQRHQRKILTRKRKVNSIDASFHEKNYK